MREHFQESAQNNSQDVPVKEYVATAHGHRLEVERR